MEYGSKHHNACMYSENVIPWKFFSNKQLHLKFIMSAEQSLDIKFTSSDCILFAVKCIMHICTSLDVTYLHMLDI